MKNSLTKGAFFKPTPTFHTDSVFYKISSIKPQYTHYKHVITLIYLNNFEKQSYKNIPILPLSLVCFNPISYTFHPS